VHGHGDGTVATVTERAPGLGEDLRELAEIADGDASPVDKAKPAVGAMTDVGAPGGDASRK